MKNLQGIAASQGIAIAKAYTPDVPDLSFETKEIDDVEAEVKRLHEALDVSKDELEKIREHARQSVGDEHAEVFSAHLLILSDTEVIGPIEDKVKDEQINEEDALDDVTQMLIKIFEEIDN